MPVLKRKAASAKAAAPAKKKARVDDSTPKAEPGNSTSRRSKRTSIGTPQYNFTRPREPNKKQADDGFEAEETVADPPDQPKRRGRPSKASTTAASKSKPAPATGVAQRGRPKGSTSSAKPNTQQPSPSAVNDLPAARPRGRPPKVESSSTKPTTKQTSHNSIGAAPVVKARGRPRKSADSSSLVQTETKDTPKRKATVQTKKKPDTALAAIKKGTYTPGKRGRPPKAIASPSTGYLNNHPEDISGSDDSDFEGSDEEQGERQYWLMKAEPNDRFEKGINVKFSIDDLAAADAPEPWDGVRNYVARNNMRVMRKGDLAFFYHSNCPIPGIVGVMRIVQEHTTDQSAFDPNHPYYDPKSVPGNPKWDCVHVEFVKKFDSPITLKMLQENKNSTKELADMQLLRQGRLSVSGVTPMEWRFILEMANEELNIGEDAGHTVNNDGYESETDGEVNDGPKEELNGVIANGSDGSDAAEGEAAHASGDQR